ncbi:DUF4397 domain-containing protein [Persicimonas caeni]|uniref:DUF4397 domain-containing protein n=1 Tax=Persicimonas caeni TaxID=2292766 RepID=A0A4Y6PRR9_PERCE|nr:DUF4397 domain-containing protein [Persicimonas caeni]QDG51016.1 DUF4397 domain-containing protein [Persicimonas caeni]QED32237.1 DUF4397 domain-containing protein [Persicimonas caeni]
MTTYAKWMQERRTLFLIASLAMCLAAAGCSDDDDDDLPPDIGFTDVDEDQDIGEDVVEDVGEEDADEAEDVGEDAEPADIGDGADAADVGDAEDDVEDDADGATALVQIIHASPDDAASVVDVWVNDELLLDDFAYLTATPFVAVPAGVDLDVDITAADATDNSNPVYSQTIPGTAVTEDATAVAIASGLVGDNFAIRLGPAQQNAPSGQTAVQIFHGVPDAPTVDVTAAGGLVTLAEGISFGDFSGITTVDSNDVVADVLLAGTTTAVVSLEVPLSNFAGDYLTVVARGTIDTTDDAEFGATAFGADGNSIDLEAPEQ